MNQPKILFLDEPTTGIDQNGQEKFLQLLVTQLKQKLGLTLVMVSRMIFVRLSASAMTAWLASIPRFTITIVRKGLSPDVLFKVFQCDLDAVLDTHSGAQRNLRAVRTILPRRWLRRKNPDGTVMKQGARRRKKGNRYCQSVFASLLVRWLDYAIVAVVFRFSC